MHNTLATPSDISEAALEEAIVTIQGFKSQSGLLVATLARRLIIPRQRQFDVSRLLNSKLRTDTANNDINAIYNDDYIPEGYRVNQYLTSGTKWFIITDADNGLKHFQRQDIVTDTDADFTTGNILLKAQERYSFGITNPRAIFGSGT
jgi:hypothetical protein